MNIIYSNKSHKYNGKKIKKYIKKIRKNINAKREYAE